MGFCKLNAKIMVPSPLKLGEISVTTKAVEFSLVAVLAKSNTIIFVLILQLND